MNALRRRLLKPFARPRPEVKSASDSVSQCILSGVNATHAASKFGVIQVGPARGSGGIADVMRAIDEWARREGRTSRLISTSCDGGRAKRLLVGVTGVASAAMCILAEPHAIVHVHSASGASFLRKSLVVSVAHRFRRPLVLHIHGGLFAAYSTGGSSRRRARVSRALRRADTVIVLNDAAKRALRELAPGADVRIVENPATLVCGLATNPASSQVLFLGRLQHHKGVDVLLEAIRALQADGLDADFVLAGDGEVEQCRAVASRLPQPSRIHIPGWVDGQGVHRLLHESSIFCLPSRVEGLPMALLQAMGHGLACVVTPVGGMGQLLADGDTGIVVPTDDARALAVAIGELVKDVDLRAELGARAFALIQAKYTPEIVMRRLDVIYTEIVNRDRSAHALS
jgi:glycosyltransferase involved in cell wall biosynthesis